MAMLSAAEYSWAFRRFGQLQQAVNRADQAPFALRFLKATQHELPEPASVLDLTEDRLNRRLEQPVPTAPTRPCQFGANRRHPGTLGAAASAGGARLMMTLAPGVLSDLLQRRGELLHAGGAVAQLQRHDSLRYLSATPDAHLK
jgi:hypothetical protein